MNSADILSLLEKPTRDPWPFIYQVRDEAAVSDIVAALRASTIPRIHRQLCYVLKLRAGAAFFAGRSSETKQAIPALIAALADTDMREEAIDALRHIGDSAAEPALFLNNLKHPVATFSPFSSTPEQFEASGGNLFSLFLYS